MTEPVGVILGSGVWHVLEEGGSLDLGGGRAADTPFGPSRPIFEATLPGGRRVRLITRHGVRGYEVGAWNLNYRANLWALRERGVECVLATSACGGVDPDLEVGDVVLPHDIIDMTAGRAKTFFETRGLGVIRHAQPFCPATRAALAEGLRGEGIEPVAEGVYVCTDGPRLETPAEIRAFASWGATLVGMTVAPEFALARELEMCYAPLCFVVNPAEGVGDRPYRPDVLFEGMALPEEQDRAGRAAARIPRVLAATIERIDDDRRCHCRQAMERYRKRGQIGEDFRTWIDD